MIQEGIWTIFIVFRDELSCPHIRGVCQYIRNIVKPATMPITNFLSAIDPSSILYIYGGIIINEAIIHTCQKGNYFKGRPLLGGIFQSIVIGILIASIFGFCEIHHCANLSCGNFYHYYTTVMSLILGKLLL